LLDQGWDEPLTGDVFECPVSGRSHSATGQNRHATPFELTFKLLTIQELRVTIVVAGGLVILD